MKIAINQAYFMPYLGFFQLIESVDKFILYDRVTYRKKSWMTRNRLLNYSNGKPFNINIPVQRPSSFALIKDIKLTPNYAEWSRRFFLQLTHNYRHAPHFESTYAFLHQLLVEAPSTHLQLFNVHLIKGLSNYLDIGTIIQGDNEGLDFIESMLATEEQHSFGNEPDRKTKRIFEICRVEKATRYVNLPGGQDLYDAQTFHEANIDLSFLAMPSCTYAQFKYDFVPHLSIIDVLMHLGQKGTKNLVETPRLVSPSVLVKK